MAQNILIVEDVRSRSGVTARVAQNILIVEDDPDVTEALAWNLEREGFEVRSAPDGLNARQMV